LAMQDCGVHHLVELTETLCEYIFFQMRVVILELTGLWGKSSGFREKNG